MKIRFGRPICDGCEYNSVEPDDSGDYTCDACGYKGYFSEYDDVSYFKNMEEADNFYRDLFK